MKKTLLYSLIFYFLLSLRLQTYALPGDMAETAIQRFKTSHLLGGSHFIKVINGDTTLSYVTGFSYTDKVINISVVLPNEDYGTYDIFESFIVDNLLIEPSFTSENYDPRKYKQVLDILTNLWGSDIANDFTKSILTNTDLANENEPYATRVNIYKGNNFGYRIKVDRLGNSASGLENRIIFSVFSLKDWNSFSKVPYQHSLSYKNIYRSPADQIDFRLTVPPEITLNSAKIQKGGGTFFGFQGEMWITGTFVVRWEKNEKNADEMLFGLIPDKYSLLPQIKPYESDIHIRGGGEQIMQAAFGKDLAKRLSLKQVNAAQVYGRFLVTNYSTGVICDGGASSGNVILSDVSQNVTPLESGRDLKIGC